MSGAGGKDRSQPDLTARDSGLTERSKIRKEKAAEGWHGLSSFGNWSEESQEHGGNLAKWTQGMPLQVALATDSAPIPGDMSGEKRRQTGETGVMRDHEPYTWSVSSVGADLGRGLVPPTCSWAAAAAGDKSWNCSSVMSCLFCLWTLRPGRNQSPIQRKDPSSGALHWAGLALHQSGQLPTSSGG